MQAKDDGQHLAAAQFAMAPASPIGSREGDQEGERDGYQERVDKKTRQGAITRRGGPAARLRGVNRLRGYCHRWRQRLAAAPRYAECRRLRVARWRPADGPARAYNRWG